MNPVEYSHFLDQLVMEPKEAEEERTVNFVLMVRKGNKPQYKNLEVPIDSDLALNLKNREQVCFHLFSIICC
jgi:Up-frameshift suppressor 2